MSEARLYQFLCEIYGDRPEDTRVEVEVEALSGGYHGTPHLEATTVHVYAGERLRLPDFVVLPYWLRLLAANPTLFQGSVSPEERLAIVQERMAQDKLCLAYGLDWPIGATEWVVSPLSFALDDLRGPPKGSAGIESGKRLS